MERALSAWNAHETVAQTRKRCPNCLKMVDVGEPVVARDERTQATSGKTPWIGNRQSYTRGAWHLYHPQCWTDFLDALEAAEQRTAAERDAQLEEMRALVAEGR